MTGKRNNFLLKVDVDERRIRFEVCSVKPWKAMGVEEPVCEANDGLPGGREKIEVFCDPAAFSNLASARFSIAEFTSRFLHLAPNDFYIHASSKEWLTVSNAADRSNKTRKTFSPLSNDSLMSFVTEVQSWCCEKSCTLFV